DLRQLASRSGRHLPRHGGFSNGSRAMRGRRMPTRPRPSWVRSLPATIALVVGCLDVPIIHVEPPAGDAGDAAPPARDAELEAGDAARPCEVCIRAAPGAAYGCGDKMAACSADAQCSGTIECALSIGCFELPNQGAVI